MPPKVSIVITVYNYERYVSLAIDSALAQTKPADEILVVDDGSTDGSGRIIGHYEDRIQSISQENRGNVRAFETGYYASKGDILVFLDADDVLFPTAIEEIVRHWDQGVSKVQYNLQIIDESGHYLNRLKCDFPARYTSQRVHQDFLKSGTYVWPVMSGNAYARSFLDEVIPLNPPVGYDGALNTIAPLYGNVVTIQRSLGQYRLHGRNISLNDSNGRAQRFPDFSRQIGFRVVEFSILSEHCRKKGIRLQSKKPIDNEIVFVNYRLACRKLGLKYTNHEKDSSIFLLGRGLSLALEQSGSWRSAISHTIWFFALYLSPKALAKQLLLYRFNRAEGLRLFRSTIPLSPTSKT